MISKKNLIQLIGRFRELCLKRYKEDIDTISPDERANRFGIPKSDWSSILKTSIMLGPIEDIVRLVKTPRLLKLILRRIYRTWEALHGEIDFDDLLIANVLRYASPDTFDFIIENVQEIRGLGTEGVLTDRADRLEAVETKWNRIIQNVRWDSTSAKHIVQFLFPCWNNKRSSIHHSLQTVQIESPTDYWERLLLEELRPDEIADQEVLHSLVRWKEEPSGHHIQGSTVPMVLARNEEYAEKFEHFSPQVLDGHEIRVLATALFKEGMSMHGVSASCDKIPGFKPLLRRAIAQPIDEKEHLEWVLQQISELLPMSLRFANDVYSDWGANDQFCIPQEQNRQNFRNQIVSVAKKLFSHSPERFVKIIDPHYMHSSHNFCINLSKLDQGGEGFPFAEWRWFTSLLIEAGKIDAQTIVPQIARFVVEKKLKIPDITYRFDEKIAGELFSGSMEDLMAILSKDINLEDFDERQKARIKCAQQAASDWLKKQVGHSEDNHDI